MISFGLPTKQTLAFLNKIDLFHKAEFLANTKKRLS